MTDDDAKRIRDLKLSDIEESDLIRGLLYAVGENPDREGLTETPERVLKAWTEMTRGYNMDPASILKTFEDGAESVDQMVFQGAIPLWSTCEHHMLPFFGVAHIGYIPNGRILGLSKFARLVDVFSRRLTVQERITREIADALETNLKPLGVGVVLQCRHSCMEARGVCRAGSVTISTALRGGMKDNQSARAEFLSMVRTSSQGHW